MTLPEPVRMTEEEYLAFERAAETKHEYHQGDVVAMVGASREHNRIVADLLTALNNRIGDRCEVFSQDLRLRVRDARLYTYPDLLVVCGKPEFDDRDRDTLLNPTVIVEVLSPSTELYDRSQKFRGYRVLPSLREYVLVAQSEPRIEQFVRHEPGRWLWRESASLDATLELPSLGCAVPLGEIYRRVSFG